MQARLNRSILCRSKEKRCIKCPLFMIYFFTCLFWGFSFWKKSAHTKKTWLCWTLVVLWRPVYWIQAVPLMKPVPFLEACQAGHSHWRGRLIQVKGTQHLLGFISAESTLIENSVVVLNEKLKHTDWLRKMHRSLKVPGIIQQFLESSKARVTAMKPLLYCPDLDDYSFSLVS